MVFKPREPTDKTIILSNARRLSVGLIAPSAEDFSYDLAGEHTSEPIKSMDDINKISRYLIANKKYRDNMLFIVGINFGLRVSDLVSLRFHRIIGDGGMFRENFSLLEQKTANTRSKRRNRYITINLAVIDAVTLYLENTPNVKLSDYLFRSKSNRGRENNTPLHRNSVDKILKDLAAELGLSNKMATHTMRKTFGYHQMVMSGNDPRKLLLLQKMFGHSTSAQTLDYIGITNEEIQEAYNRLNLGSLSCNYLIDSSLGEEQNGECEAEALYTA